jgi:hypothetical protein
MADVLVSEDGWNWTQDLPKTRPVTEPRYREASSFYMYGIETLTTEHQKWITQPPPPAIVAHET